jgi:hypothetical protein
MDNISNGLGFGASSSDPKAAVMNQVRQEAAMTNARQLIEVRSPRKYLKIQFQVSCRKSTSTASRNASPNPVPHYRAPRRLASHNAWRSIWRHGIRSAGNTSREYSRRLPEVLVVVEYFKAERCEMAKRKGNTKGRRWKEDEKMKE